MTEADVILYIVIGTALAFDFTNGFHDTANVVATSISTRAMSPRVAVTYAAILNFAGAFISLEVAATVAAEVVEAGVITPTIVFAGLVGAIVWNLATWYYGLPSSSSHALIGGVVGSTFAAVGSSAVLVRRRYRQGARARPDRPDRRLRRRRLAIVVCYRLVGRQRPGPVTRGFRLGQVVSGGMLALAHGTNDAQKTMGIITLALIANGTLDSGSDPPTWVIVSAATAISLGHLHGRLANHPHHGHAHHQDGRRAGVFGSGRGLGRDPGLEPLRIPPLDDAGDLRRRHGRGGRQARLRRPLGRSGEHRDGLAFDLSDGCRHRGAHLWGDADLR